MKDVPLATFQKAILELHGESATYVAHHRVSRHLRWSDRVGRRDLEFSFSGGKCHAWEVDGRITTVLQAPHVKTPLDAVRAMIADQLESRKK